ncbi:DUF1223 domain-containing protein [Pelagibaculum spongiae]|nr:DUF1223 domain-containing protein [Pelagibaculum spongiae]
MKLIMMTKNLPLKTFTLLGLTFALAFSAVTQAQTLESGNDKNHLLELYTSEGCSSCPPADRLVSSLKDSDELWKKYVPVAFHVDYWDYLGWKDPFASAENSKQQRKKVKDGHARSVYTPAFFIGGKEWRGFFRKRKLSGDNIKTGNLKISVEGNSFQASYNPTQQSYAASKLHIAILGMDRTTKVPKGENAGRTLPHDFVSLQHLQLTANKASQWQQDIDLCRFEPPIAIAAWVDGKKAPAIQALGGKLSLDHC